MTWLALAFIYALGVLAVGRVAYRYAVTRPRDYISDGRKATRDDGDDRWWSLIVAVVWPITATAVVTFLTLRTVLRLTVWRETPTQRAAREEMEYKVAQDVLDSLRDKESPC